MLSTYLKSLDITSAKRSSEFIGTKEENPSIILEENVSKWIRVCTIEDLEECLQIFTENVCVCNFPARFSPQFWLAHSALSAIYQVLCGFVERQADEDVQHTTDKMLFELWKNLISAGPGSTHLEMMTIILKNSSFPLWKYMQTIHGETLNQLLTTLKTDFVYAEDVKADHYATLMETHIDTIFKLILTDAQVEEARRGLMELHIFYLTRMNHVPHHIGPRLSHLCFLIFNRYEHENPFLGLDDWVVLRYHLKFVKDVITDRSFRPASEAQYRVPKTLEKIFQAAISDKMLELMFKDFMTLLHTICNNANSKRCKKLFDVYREYLFEQIDVSKDFEETPQWLLESCLETLILVTKTVGMESHIDEMIISAEQFCLQSFPKLKGNQISRWQDLITNHIVSGRLLLIQEATRLLHDPTLTENKVVCFKSHMDQGRLLVDILADLPCEFMEKDEQGSVTPVVDSCASFLDTLLKQLCAHELEARDTSLLKDLLFSVDKVLKDANCPSHHLKLTEILETILMECNLFFRTKGYLPVDYNSLMKSVIFSCISADLSLGESPPDSESFQRASASTDMYASLYENIIMPFIKTHKEKHTLDTISSVVQEVMYEIQNCIQREGTGYIRCVRFLSDVATLYVPILEEFAISLVDLFLPWGCFILDDVLLALMLHNSSAFIGVFQHIFNEVLEMPQEEKHRGLKLIKQMSSSCISIFDRSHSQELLNVYENETEQSQILILDILFNIAEYSPALMSGCLADLTDESKFCFCNFSRRLRIIRILKEEHDDMIDFVMKFADNKDVETAEQALREAKMLINGNIKLINKYRKRLKGVQKSSSSKIMKELCAEMLPEIPLQKSTNVVKAPQGLVVKNRRNATTSDKSNIQKSNVKTLKQNKRTAKATDSDKTSVVDGKKENGNALFVNYSSVSKDIGKTVNIEKQPLLNDASINGANSDITPEKNDTLEMDMKTQDSLNQETESVKMVSEIGHLKISKEKVKTCAPKEERNEINTIDRTQHTADICLHCNSFSRAKAQDLSMCLEKFGFPNTLLTKDHNLRDVHAKLIVYCPCDGERNGEVIWEILARTPFIAVKLHNSDWIDLTDVHVPVLVGSVIKDKQYIRLYSKPGEKCIEKTSFPENKMSELLMRLNYMGFHSSSGYVQIEKDQSKQPPAYPRNVYLSYHWSKQNAVQRLYEALTSAGYGCWMGCLQISGSDSLYNTIASGIQECRVVVACITKHYHLSDVCQREIALAHNLGRPVIPVLFKNSSLPIKGNIGKTFLDTKPLIFNELISVDSIAMTSLKQKINNCSGLDAGEFRQECEDEDSMDELENVRVMPILEVKLPVERRKVQKSMSLAHIERHKEAIDKLLQERHNSDVDFYSDGHRSLRSKSCTIL
ncbi:uncharacterized protein LOC128228995 isoform X2 [Mya arenaria]|uniref:uncharacterized protein LOC128228995 isoform X2 n=1 Tax=Mya arenaria TaxID=6604 RepID=UPI0022E6C519|nr:uncharacterized protein LOC128228995 isoform X2 [Mya arenaria]